jgi:tight adherence protein B
MNAGTAWLGSLALGALQLLALSLLGAAVACAVFSSTVDPRSLVNRAYGRYVTHLERQLRSMFIATKGRVIVVWQALATFLVVVIGLAAEVPFWWAALPVVIYGPVWYIAHQRRERINAVDAKLESVITALSNALKTTPSLGSALSFAQPLTPEPMRDEFALTLKEVRVGVTVEQSLMNMCTRIGSPQLDAAVAGLLIGRQVGGDLPKILETIAQTLREMARLSGLLRAKTADGRAQIGVMMFFPLVLLIGFDTVKPGYFAPLTSTFAGYVVMLVAGGMWLAAVLLARKMLKVDI